MLSAGSKSGGFSLMEMLVVVLLLAMVLALIPMTVGRSIGAQMQAALRDLSYELRRARADAVTHRTSIAVWVDTAANTYQRDANADLNSFPEGASVEVTAAQQEVVGDKAAIRFFPDGSASGGRILLQHSGLNYEIAIDWLTGGVSTQWADQ